MVYSKSLRRLIMKIKISKKPRIFTIKDIQIKDYGKIKLDTNEMISFITESGKEYDFVAKDWGFYMTPSINGRLKREGFKIAIVKNEAGKIYIMAVEKEKKVQFKKYCSNQKQKILNWIK
jgi:hypothetical protein